MSLTPWSRSSGIAIATALAGLAVAVPGPLTSSAQLTDTRSISGNTMSTRLACPSPPPFYAVAVLAETPTFYWRLGEEDPPAVTSVADA